MNRTLKIGLIISLVLITLGGVAYYCWLNPKKALNFVVPSFSGIANIEVEIKGDTAYLDIYSVMKNKAPYPINIKELEYTVCLAEHDILSETQYLDMRQTPGQIDTMNLFVRLPYKSIRDLLESIQDQDSTTVGARFAITYETMFGEVTIPALFDIPIKTPNPPEIELNKIKLGFFNFKERKFQLILDIDIINENNVKVSLAELEYEAEFGENLSGYGSQDEVITVEANARSNITLPIIISVDKPMDLIWKIITNKDRMDYEFNLKGVLLMDDPKRKDVPFDVTLNGDAELVK